MPIRRDNKRWPIILAAQRKQKVGAPAIITGRINQPQLGLIVGRLVARNESQEGAAVGVVVVGHAVTRLGVDDLDVVGADGVGAGRFSRVAIGRVVGAGVEVKG